MTNQEAILKREVEKISVGFWEDLNSLEALDPILSSRVVAIILEFACTSQNINSITAGRAAFEKLPRTWLVSHLDEIIANNLDLTDEWVYRRLLELLDVSMPNWLQRYVSFGLGSRSVEIVDAAHDFESRA